MLKARIYPGMNAWVAWGDSGWSAIKIVSIGRKYAKVERVNPKTGKFITRKAKAKISELVRRNPRKKGKDKPAAPPKEIFAEQRKQEEAKTKLVSPPANKRTPEDIASPASKRTPQDIASPASKRTPEDIASPASKRTPE